MRRILQTTMGAVCAAGLALPGAAWGAEASVSSAPRVIPGNKGPDTTITVYTLTVTAGPGEINQPRAALGADGTIMLTEAVAPITPGAGCTAVSEREVSCKAGAALPTSLRVLLGDGDDVVEPGAATGSFESITYEAGPGADRLQIERGTADGGEGDDQLRGGADAQTLRGGPGADVLEGGDGTDQLDGGPGSDRLSGGPGSDSVSYATETAPVTVDLAAPGAAGTAVEPDLIDGFEQATGGAGDDVLRGTEAEDGLHGGAGSDRLEGRGGNDSLLGGRGPDTIDGGAGDDFMNADEYEPTDIADDVLDGGPGDDRVRSASGADTLLGGDGDDSVEATDNTRRVDAGAGNDSVEMSSFGRPRVEITCGAGRDQVQYLTSPAVAPRDCELAVLSEDEAVSTRLRVRRGRLLVSIPYYGRCCRVTVTLRANGRTIARARPRARASVTHAEFRLDRKLRRALRRATIDVRYGTGEVAETLRLQTP